MFLSLFTKVYLNEFRSLVTGTTSVNAAFLIETGKFKLQLLVDVGYLSHNFIYELVCVCVCV